MLHKVITHCQIKRIFSHRFKDDKLILTEPYTAGSGSSLTLLDSKLSDSGEYRCRANNYFSARYSMEASVTVKGSIYHYK